MDNICLFYDELAWGNYRDASPFQFKTSLNWKIKVRACVRAVVRPTGGQDERDGRQTRKSVKMRPTMRVMIDNKKRQKEKRKKSDVSKVRPTSELLPSRLGHVTSRRQLSN